MSSRYGLAALLLLSSLNLLAAEEELPSDELLEFLGSFESADGEWIDPHDFEVPLIDTKVAERGGHKDE